MSHNRANSLALRGLALEFIGKLAEEWDLSEYECADLATSLVRQWVTYDRNAVLFLDEDLQLYLSVGMTPLGRLAVAVEPAGYGELERLARQWDVDPADFPELVDQLNIAQSAEVVNAEGVRLRLWVNPKDRMRGVEPLDPVSSRRPRPPDYRKMAAYELERRLGAAVGADELEELVCSVERQWRRYEGHACVFLNADSQLLFDLTARADAGYLVQSDRRSINLAPMLTDLGLSPEQVPELLARLNRGQEIALRNRDGVPCVLTHNPTARRFVIRPSAAGGPPARPSALAPILCPACSAVLSPWRDGEREQPCPLCGHTVSIG